MRGVASSQLLSELLLVLLWFPPLFVVLDAALASSTPPCRHWSCSEPCSFVATCCGVSPARVLPSRADCRCRCRSYCRCC
ncbi:hypothetical protein BVRB_9g209630 [Beta vulgaris subsp. vulgaris]|nr:hypothetical protein BVRB_9g209630 [Beta vulgaris subsp. vulgaris]